MTGRSTNSWAKSAGKNKCEQDVHFIPKAINYYLESFSDNFQSPQITMANFAMLEMQGKPMDYYKNLPR